MLGSTGLLTILVKSTIAGYILISECQGFHEFGIVWCGEGPGLNWVFERDSESRLKNKEGAELEVRFD